MDLTAQAFPPRTRLSSGLDFDLADRQKLTIDFRPFIHVEGMDAQEFRQQKVDMAEHTAVILTSRLAVDHYFRMAKEMRFEVPRFHEVLLHL